MNIFPNRLVHLESNEVFSQAEEYRQLAEKLGGEYEPITFEGEVTFDPGDTLVKKFAAMYHVEGTFGRGSNSFDRKKATAAAVELVARMAKAGAEQNAPGFNVDYIRSGDKLEFLADDRVKVTYTPKGEKAPQIVTLDLLGRGRHEGTIDKSRSALEGTRLQVFERSIEDHSLYNVFKVLGYDWGDKAYEGAFLTKLKEAGFEGKSIHDDFLFEFLSAGESEDLFDKIKSQEIEGKGKEMELN